MFVALSNIFACGTIIQGEVIRMFAQKAAVLSDIHSNYHALKACIEDAVRRGATCFVFLGDYVSDLADPQSTLDLIYDLQSRYPCYLVRGNRDRYMLDCRNSTFKFSPGSKSGSLYFTYQNLRQRDFAFLQSLPIYRQIDLFGVNVEIAHASPDQDRQYFDDEDGNLHGIFPQMRTNLLLTGHSHKQYICQKNGRTILNPGSVGVPVGPGGLSQYALIEYSDTEIRCIFRHVHYDLEAVVNRQFDSGLVEMAPYWAMSVLYDLITGQNWSMALLDRVYGLCGDDSSAVQDERLWEHACVELNIPRTREDLLSAYRTGSHDSPEDRSEIWSF
jgi:predicted phosphodiesterase